MGRILHKKSKKKDNIYAPSNEITPVLQLGISLPDPHIKISHKDLVKLKTQIYNENRYNIQIEIRIADYLPSFTYANKYGITVINSTRTLTGQTLKLEIKLSTYREALWDDLMKYQKSNKPKIE